MKYDEAGGFAVIFSRRRGSFVWNTWWYSTLVTFSRLFSGLLRIGILWFVGQLRSRHSYILSEWACASSRCPGSSICWKHSYEQDSTSQVEIFVVWTTGYVIRPPFAARFPVELAAEMACRHNLKTLLRLDGSHLLGYLPLQASSYSFGRHKYRCWKCPVL